MVYASPQEAEAAFYDAFERRDIESMMAVWADDEAIVCVHPMGSRLQGRAAIERSWRELFAGGAGLKFRLSDAQYSRDDTLSVHCLYENITYGPASQQRSRVIATNVYRRIAGGWRLVVHHATPGTAEAPPAQESAQTLH